MAIKKQQQQEQANNNNNNNHTSSRYWRGVAIGALVALVAKTTLDILLNSSSTSSPFSLRATTTFAEDVSSSSNAAVLVTSDTIQSEQQQQLPLTKEGRTPPTITIGPLGSVDVVYENPEEDENAFADIVPSEVFRREYQEIADVDNAERCQRYGFRYGKTRKGKPPRRVFFGSLIADDSLLLMKIHATEMYGIYHTVALVESNTTQMKIPRKMKFPPGSDNEAYLQSGIFGPNTKVFVDQYLDADPDLNGLDREHTQRYQIVDRWIEGGMTVDDIGIVADVDEIFSRDFVVAAQTCDVPPFEHHGQNCQKPKIISDTLVFEGSPECITKGHRWYHPDMIVGHCVDRIGNATGRHIAKRTHPKSTRDKFGEKDHPPEVMKKQNFPLWTPADYRQAEGSLYVSMGQHKEPVLSEARKKEREEAAASSGTPPPKRRFRAFAAAYHLHNFFDDFSTLRFKYKTYGHPVWEADTMKLGALHPDVNLMVRCAHGLPNRLPKPTPPPVPEGEEKKEEEENNDDMTSKRRFMGGYDGVEGDKPIFFKNETFRWERQAALRQMVFADEAEHGAWYSPMEESDE